MVYHVREENRWIQRINMAITFHIAKDPIIIMTQKWVANRSEAFVKST